MAGKGKHIPRELEAAYRVRRPQRVPLAAARDDLRTLWKANLRVGTSKDNFLFRWTADFETASATAVSLLEASPGAHMTGAELIGIERVGHLWN